MQGRTTLCTKKIFKKFKVMNSNKYLEQWHLKHYKEAILNITQEIPHIFILEFQIKH